MEPSGRIKSSKPELPALNVHQDGRLELESRHSDTPHKASLRAPATITIALLTGLGFALAHHFMAQHLNDKPVADVNVDLSQAWVSRFGTALAFLVKLALATAVGTAYTQHQWSRLHSRIFKTDEVDALTSVLSNAFSFLSSTVWLRHPFLALMALVSWGIPLAAIIAPGSLTVSPVSRREEMSLQVRQPYYNLTNFGSLTGGGGSVITADARVYNLAYRTASTGQPLSMDYPEHHQNASYHLNFEGPAVKCSSGNETWLDELTYRYGVQGPTRDITQFLSWTASDSPSRIVSGESSSTLDTTSTDAARIYVMTNTGTWNENRFYNGSETDWYRQVNFTECLLFNATYSVDYTFSYPDQAREASIFEWLNPVAIPRYWTEAEKNGTEDAIMAYGTIMDAFGQMLVGDFHRDRYNSEKASLTSSQIMDIDWTDGEAVRAGLEGLFQNITLSLLSDDQFIKNSSMAEFVPVIVTTWPVTYVYTKSDLLAAYGTAFVCALLCSFVGLYAFFVNKASYQNMFSTYLRATNDLDARSKVEPGDTGSDPLPKVLARSRLALGGGDNVEPGQAGSQDVELEQLRPNSSVVSPMATQSVPLKHDHSIQPDSLMLEDARSSLHDSSTSVVGTTVQIQPEAERRASTPRTNRDEIAPGYPH